MLFRPANVFAIPIAVSARQPIARAWLPCATSLLRFVNINTPETLVLLDGIAFAVGTDISPLEQFTMYVVGRVPLGGKKHPGLVAFVDAEFEEELRKHSWYPKREANTYYAAHKVYADGKQTTLRLHQAVLSIAGIDTPKGMIVDHRDGNGLNNCLFNLRVVSRSQNQQNKQAYGASSYIGVTWHKHTKKWRARIRNMCLGFFDNEVDAAVARDRATIKHFGEFGRLNFPPYQIVMADYESFGLAIYQPLNDETLAGMVSDIVAGLPVAS